jgi:hypothetical protein
VVVHFEIHCRCDGFGDNLSFMIKASSVNMGIGGGGGGIVGGGGGGIVGGGGGR